MNSKGLTLIENMIAMLIFSIVFLAVASMQIHSMKINTKAQAALCHSIAVTELLENILALPYDDPSLRDTDNVYAPANPDHGPFKIATSPGTIEWEVEDQFPVAKAKRVHITIRTPDDLGSQNVLTYDYLKIKGLE
jgi:prepilin-type N-terminal cleavage/methylation domain-containing protein